MRWPWQWDRIVLDDRRHARDVSRERRECRKRIEELAKAGDPKAIAWLERETATATPTTPSPAPR